MYPQDFPDERFTPVIDLPMIIAGLLLVALAVAAGYAFARMKDRDRQPTSRAVAASIHAAIQRKLNAALAVHGGATSNAAQALVDEVEIRLGDVVRLTGDLDKATSALKDALAGKRKPVAHPPPPPPVSTPHAVIVPVPGQGGGATASAASNRTGAAVAEVSTPEGGLVGAILSLSPPSPALPPAPFSAAEQTAAVRAAVEAFAVHWGTTPTDPASSARIDELIAAARQLTTEVPTPRVAHGPTHH